MDAIDLSLDDLLRIADALREHREDAYWGADEALIAKIDARASELKREEALRKVSRLDDYYSGSDGVIRI